MTGRAPWTRLDTALAGALAAVTVASRAAARAHEPTTWDAGLFANGVRDYDVLAGQPHAPGYPLTIALAKLIAIVVDDPAAAMVWLSVLASASMVALAYDVGRRMAGRPAGALAGVALLLSPVALYNGAVGLSYAAEGAASAAVALLAWRAGERATTGRLVALGLGLAAAAGIRPSSLLFLAPLALWPLVASVAPLRQRLRSLWPLAGAALAGGLAWAVPMLAAGGGLQVFAANRFQSRTVVFTDSIFQSGWAVVPRNLHLLANYADQELPALRLLVPSLVLLVLAAGAWRMTWWRPAVRPLAFLALWILPAFAFYAVIYAGAPIYPDGYLLVLLPGIAVGLGALLAGLAGAAWRRPGVVPQMAVGLACILLVFPGHALAEGWGEAVAPIHEADAWAVGWEGFDEEFPANETALLTFTSWLYVKLREPDHLQWVTTPYSDESGQSFVQVLESRQGRDTPRFYEGILDGPMDPMHPIPDWVDRIVLREQRLTSPGEGLLKPQVTVHEERLAGGGVVHWFAPNGNWTVIESYLRWVDPAWSEAQPRGPPAEPVVVEAS